MDTFDWRRFLQQWSEQWSGDLLESSDIIPADLSRDVIERGWLGNPGATEEQIRQAEERLRTTLPLSYRAFLKVSNGWRWMRAPLWSTEEVEWLSVRNQEFIDNWSALDLPISDDEYFTYGEQQLPVVRAEYISSTLEISDWGNAEIYLLNPRVTIVDDEWEAWYYASYIPGAYRYRSFQELMQAEYETFVNSR